MRILKSQRETNKNAKTKARGLKTVTFKLYLKIEKLCQQNKAITNFNIFEYNPAKV